jgi:hypothetical protein
MVGPNGDLICHHLRMVTAETCRGLLAHEFGTEGISAAAMDDEIDAGFKPEEEDEDVSVADFVAEARGQGYPGAQVNQSAPPILCFATFPFLHHIPGQTPTNRTSSSARL